MVDKPINRSKKKNDMYEVTGLGQYFLCSQWGVESAEAGVFLSKKTSPLRIREEKQEVFVQNKRKNHGDT